MITVVLRRNVAVEVVDLQLDKAMDPTGPRKGGE
jgi:hypothetical protein